VCEAVLPVGVQEVVVRIKITTEQQEAKEAELKEKDEHGDYTRGGGHAAEKRVQNSKSITEEKDGAKAEAKDGAKDAAEKGVQNSKSITEKKDDAKKQVFGQPVDFCLISNRWRDAKGRYCRPPSPARPAR
jgi:activator of HSP90 ATPase